MTSKTDIKTFKNNFSHLLLWKGLLVDGKNAGRWDGSGSVKDWRRKSVRENWEERNSHNSVHKPIKVLI